MDKVTERNPVMQLHCILTLCRIIHQGGINSTHLLSASSVVALNIFLHWSVRLVSLNYN